MRRLLLFDIDGTLLAGATNAHRDALNRALEHVHGVDVDRLGLDIAPAGRTDGEIAAFSCPRPDSQAATIDTRAEEVADETARLYAELCDHDLSRFVIDGIPQLLDGLSEAPGVHIALVTGNYEAVARLNRTVQGSAIGSPGHGAFASDAEDRLKLPPIARRRSGTARTPFPRALTILIGDTPRDIECARADELACVAVTTGPFGPDQLTGADAIATDSTELCAALESWFSAE